MNIGHRFVGFLQNSLRRINRSRATPMDPTFFPLLFPPFTQRHTVQVWLNSLLTVNFGRGMQVYVISLVQLKYNASQEHEKVVIKLKVVPEDGRPEVITWFTTERGAEIEDMNDSFASLPSPTICTSCAVHRLISTGDIPATDMVVVPAVSGRLTFEDHIENQLQRNHTVLCQISPTRAMSLAQLATLLNTIHDFSTSYTTLQYNCYWYAYTVSEVVRQEFGGLVSRDANLRRRGLYGSIRLGNETSVEGVMAAYTEDWLKIKEILDTAQREHVEQVQVHQQLLRERALREQEQVLQERALQEREQALLQERERAERLERELQENTRALQEREWELQENTRALQERERELQENTRGHTRVLQERERVERELRAEHDMQLKAALEEVARLQALAVVPH